MFRLGVIDSKSTRTTNVLYISTDEHQTFRKGVMILAPCSRPLPGLPFFMNTLFLDHTTQKIHFFTFIYYATGKITSRRYSEFSWILQ